LLRMSTRHPSYPEHRFCFGAGQMRQRLRSQPIFSKILAFNKEE
jgi:hypothetical protein